MKSIMCFGDSNTWGFMPKLEQPTMDATNRYPFDVRWTGLLQTKLGEGYRIIEEGLNGRTTMFDCPMEDHRNGLRDIDMLLVTHTPLDLVIIMLGTNDTKLTLGMTPHVIARGVERLIERIQTGSHGPGGAAPQILVVAPIRMGAQVADRWLKGEFDASSLAKDVLLAPAFEAVARRTGAHFLDAGARITADDADCIHMNAAGHATLAELMYDAVKGILG